MSPKPQNPRHAACLWPGVAAFCMAALAYMVTSSISMSLAAAAAAVLGGALTAWRLSKLWRRRADAFAAAAKGIVLESRYGAQSQDDPTTLAQQVQRIASDVQKLTRQLAVLRAVIDGMGEGVWITSENGTVIEYNNALKGLLYAGQQIAGQRPIELLRSVELQQAVEKACHEALPSHLELSIEGVVLSVHISPLARELGGSAAVFFDVTELRRLEKIRKDFVANISHELRTPITAIRGYAETLQAGALQVPEKASEMVDIILRQSKRLAELVEDLLKLSDLEFRQIQFAPVLIDLTKSIQDALEAVRPQARTRGIQFDLQISPRATVLADQRALEQVLVNLLDNAVKYTAPNGHVWINVTPNNSIVEIRVRDDGPGIESKHLPRIFERFYRVDKGRSRDMGGTGLGLSIVKHLVTAMKGEVFAESGSHGGATFLVQLPIAHRKPQDDTGAVSHSDDLSFSHKFVGDV